MKTEQFPEPGPGVDWSAANLAISPRIASAGVALLVVGLGCMVSFPRVSGVVFWVFALAGLWLTLMPRKQQLVPGGMNRPVRPGRHADLWVAVAVVFAVNCLSVFVFGLRMREASWYPLLALPLLVTSLQALQVRRWMFVRGAVAACLLAITWVVVVGLTAVDLRGSLGSNAILFGQVTMAMVLVCAFAYGCPYADDPWIARWPWLAWLIPVAAFAGIAVAAVVGFRGAVLVVPVIIAALLRFKCHEPVSRRVPWIKGLAVTLALLAAVTFAGPKLTLLDRMALIESEVSTYADGSIGHSSLGSRLVMWQAALDMFSAHPWFGVGAHRFNDETQVMRERGIYPAGVDAFRHAHNSFFTVAAEYGLVGLAAFTLLVVVICRCLGRVQPAYRELGTYLLVAWGVMALTNDVLAHQGTLRAMVFGLAICLAGPPLYRPQDRPLPASLPAAAAGD